MCMFVRQRQQRPAQQLINKQQPINRANNVKQCNQRETQQWMQWIFQQSPPV